jgi:crossover junction endodeoxyribonuclease RuvC
MRVLGIDPGLRATGWGVIDVAGGRLTHVANGVIKPTTTLPDALRLGRIADDLSVVISTHGPTLAAIEEIFVAKSAKSALKLGMARGVAIMIVVRLHLRCMNWQRVWSKNQSPVRAPLINGKYKIWSHACLG